MSLRDMMHSLIGAAGQNTVTTNKTSPLQGQMTAAIQQGILAQPQRHFTATNKKLFHGMVEVLQVANGYIVNIGRKEGYEYETHIAATITEVNEIIAAQIVAFKLEDKS